MPGKLTAAEREALYTEYLRVEGYRPDTEQDGHVVFNKGGLLVVLPVSEDPDYFVMVAYPGLKVTNQNRALMYQAANHVTSELKVAKIAIDPEGDVYACVGLFCSPAEAFKAVFARCLKAVESAINSLRAQLKSEA